MSTQRETTTLGSYFSASRHRNYNHLFGRTKMVRITEEPEPQPEITSNKEPREDQTYDPKSKPDPIPRPANSSNPFAFWCYLTIGVTLITLTFVSFSSVWESRDPKTFFLSLSTPLRQHYSKGRTIKVQVNPDLAPIEVFTFQSENSKAGVSEKVVIVHGLGLNSFGFRQVVDFLGSRGVHGVAFDLPGHGFSDKSMEVVEEAGESSFLKRFMDVYCLIKEKGLFWAFDSMVETGELPYEMIQSHLNEKKRRVVRPAAMGSEEMGRVLTQVIGTLGLAPVHLVLHDSSLAMLGNWISENPSLVRGVTLVDTGTRPALPVWLLESPVVKILSLSTNCVYGKLISFCCSRSIAGSDLEGHRKMFKAGSAAVMGTDKKLNSSFDIAEWGGSDGIKGTPLQVIWSDSWSGRWSDEGKKLAEVLPQAKFVTHSGGRWPQEDAADEIADQIVNFISMLPKTVRQAEEEHIPEHIQQILDEAKAGVDHHHHHHDHGGQDHGHAHPEAAGFMNSYGLGHAWRT